MEEASPSGRGEQEATGAATQAKSSQSRRPSIKNRGKGPVRDSASSSQDVRVTSSGEAPGKGAALKGKGGGRSKGGLPPKGGSRDAPGGPSDVSARARKTFGE